MRERLGSCPYFALCENMLLLEFWHVRLVSCSVHCLLLFYFPDKLCNSSHPLLSKEEETRLRELWTKDEAVVDPLALFLHQCCEDLHGGDGGHDAASSPIPQAPALGEG